ncbi:MAG: alpha/beta hydrolase [Oscillospiraceae bacterium]|nr:alpha/beta hydrolase [Oscillospiraceae bacterium]
MKKKKSWDKKWYTDEFFAAFKATAKTITEDGLTITEKYAPDALSEIAADPRMLGGPLGKNAKMMSFLPEGVIKKMSMDLSGKGLRNFRKSCDKVSSAVCVKGGIDLTDQTVTAKDGYEIPIRIYRSEKCETNGPCLFFMHGGGFIGGSIPPYDEVWKVFVEKFSVPVVSAAYRLMPEVTYPTPHEDCYCVLEWIYQNAGTLGIDRTKIFVTGDSAGGNLAQYCSTRAKGTDMVKGQLLLYATLNIFRTEDKYYKLDGKNFVYEPKQKRLCRRITAQLEIMVNSFHKMNKKFGVTKPDPYCNPYTFDASGNPPTFISVGALDFLKNDCIAWAHKLKDAGVPVKVVVYNGMGHGYINAMGVFPQAEDVIDEMGQFIKENC